MQRLFEGATWNFVCLEADIPNKGDYRTNHVGAMPVIVVRGADGGINCFENRCAHRGALIAFDDGGNVQQQLQVHLPRLELRPRRQPARHRLRARHQRRRAACPRTSGASSFSPRKLRTTTLAGLVFATLSPDTPPIEEYLGSEVLGRLKRVLEPADPRHGPLRAAAAQQLEALCRERQGHLPREPAAHSSSRPSASRA